MQPTVRLGMNARKQCQRIDVGEQAIDEVLPDASLLFLENTNPSSRSISAERAILICISLP